MSGPLAKGLNEGGAVIVYTVLLLSAYLLRLACCSDKGCDCLCLNLRLTVQLNVTQLCESR